MLRVAYPAAYSPELFRDFPADIELIPVSEQTEGVLEVDVWIPDPYPTRAVRASMHLNGVKLVLCMMAGTEWITGLVDPHVIVCNARGAHNIATAEWTLGAILSMLKFFPFYQDVQRSAQWKGRFGAAALYDQLHGPQQPQHPPILLEELAGKRILLIGYGAIGQEIERLLTPFHVKLTRMARHEQKFPRVFGVDHLDAHLPEAEIVLLILPLNESSRHLIGAAQLALMPPGALLVNAARGPIVDTDALVDALQSGRIRAALDVTEPEPLPPDHPLWKCPNLLLTPHVAAMSPAYAQRALRIVREELQRYIQGEPLLNQVQGPHRKK